MAQGRASTARTIAVSGQHEHSRRLRLPLSLVTSEVSDMAVAVFAVICQLDNGTRGCYAAAGTLATMLGVRRETVQRALPELRPWVREDDTGRHVRTRPGRDGWAPVWTDIATKMTARQFRAYSYACYCYAVGRPITVPGVAAVLRNHGKTTARPVSEDTARRVLADLSGKLPTDKGTDRSGPAWLVMEAHDGAATTYTPQTAPTTPTEASRPRTAPPGPATRAERTATPREVIHRSEQPDHTQERNEITPTAQPDHTDSRNEITAQPQRDHTHLYDVEPATSHQETPLPTARHVSLGEPTRSPDTCPTGPPITASTPLPRPSVTPLSDELGRLRSLRASRESVTRYATLARARMAATRAETRRRPTRKGRS